MLSILDLSWAYRFQLYCLPSKVKIYLHSTVSLNQSMQYKHAVKITMPLYYKDCLIAIDVSND